jgi:two-component system LytT family sensor kinase
MIIQKSNSRLIAVLIQILVWLVFGVAILFYQPLTSDIAWPYQLWIKQAIILGMLVAAYYINSQVLMPRFLLKNHNTYYFLAVILIIAAFLTLDSYSDKWLNLHALMDAAFHRRGPHHTPRNNDMSHFDIISLIIIALVLGISTSVTAIQKWQSDKQLNLALQQEKTSSELSFLKAQINPHFFFNTLNNIYALTYADAETSRKAIHQLSRMMRYLLYDTPQAHPLLSQEVTFIKDYISLMQLRLTNAVKIEFNAPAQLADLPVASMIFLPFVENAFKHGISASEPSYIAINISQIDKMLYLSVTNSIIKNPSPVVDEYGGIGLNNTRRRLDLLYPGKYKLVINEPAIANEYSVHLTLNLS